jgi:FtsH-binding integral membrane protein
MYQDQQFQYQGGSMPVAALGAEARATFIQRTYTHLFGALAAFVLVEIALFQTGIAEGLLRLLARTNWLLFLGGFMVVGYLASRVAHSARSQGAQYAALGAYVVAEALLFAPLLYIADQYAPGAISSAALVSLVGFSALTAIVFFTRKDFSFLRGVLVWGGVVALGLIVIASFGGLSLGSAFSVGMVAYAGAAILYETSNVLHHYPEDRHVGAALGIFAAVVLLFWYVLQLFLASRD